ncbi:hypothetical protein Tco_0285353 [Tanacetum coccineum]
MEAGGKDRPPMLSPVPADTPTIPGNDGTPEQSREEVMETYATVSAETKKLTNVEAEAIQIILTGIDNDIYSAVDVCPNAMEMWKAIERFKQGKEIDKLMALILMSFKKIYKPTNNNLGTSSKTKNKNVDDTPRSDKRTGYSDDADNFGSIFDTEPLENNSNDNYNVFANKIQHPEQPEFVNDTYLVEQGDSSDMSNNGRKTD